MKGPPQLYIVTCKDGQNISFGKRQADFLMERDHIHRSGQHTYLAPEFTAHELHAYTMSFAELRECDFCTKSPAGWRIQASPFKLTMGPNAGAPIGGPTRPVFACSECVPFIRRRDKRRLIEHVIDAHFEHARELGMPRSVSKAAARRQIGGMVSEFVNTALTHQLGEPEED